MKIRFTILLMLASSLLHAESWDRNLYQFGTFLRSSVSTSTTMGVNSDGSVNVSGSSSTFKSTIYYGESLPEGTNTLGEVILSTTTLFTSADGDSLVFLDHHDDVAHQGYIFHAAERFVNVPNNGYATLFFVVGSTMNAEVYFNVQTEGKAYINGYSLPVVTSSGTLFDVLGSKNFVDYQNATAKVYRDAVVLSSGSLVLLDVVFAGEGPKTVGASTTEPVPWICNAGAYFLMTVQNLGGSAKDIMLRIYWIEEPV